MHYDNDCAGRDIDNQHHGNGQAHDTERSITVPPAVLLTELDNGTLILQGRPDGPRAYLNRAAAIPLRREPAAAFKCTEPRPRDDQDDAR